MKIFHLVFAGLVISVIVLLPVYTSAQSQGYVPNVLPPSPNASALMKFTDIPVSLYTGTADITVPIHTIQAKGLSLPISINYHTGGIRVKEEASSVGLGWALSAGGSISRTIMDKDDFSSSFPYFTSRVPQLPGDLNVLQYDQGASPDGLYANGPYLYKLSCTDKINTTAGTEDFYTAFSPNGSNGSAAFDMEPDLFDYNFGGHSGKFIVTRSGGVVLQHQDNIRITFELSGNSFTILDEHGTTFYFAAKDTLQSSSGLPSSFAISSWNISRIVTNQNDTISFSYLNDGSYTTTLPDKNETWNFGCTENSGDFFGNSAASFYSNGTLQTIDYSTGQLRFFYNGGRSDLKGGEKLDSVQLFSKVAGSLSYIKAYDFHYSYFAPPAYNQFGPDSLDQLRLRLDSVQEQSGTTVVPPYSFVYNRSSQAGFNSLLKDGFNMDHWGYYNGSTNTHLIPSFSVLANPSETSAVTSQLIQENAANREPDNTAAASFSSNFSLAEIHYPTGGKSVFAYEPNDYDQQNSTIRSSSGGSVDFQQQQIVTLTPTLNMGTHGTITGTLDLSKIYPVVPPGQPSTGNLTLDVAFLGTGNSTIDYHTQQAGKIYFTLTGASATITEDITDPTLSGNPNVYSTNKSLVIVAGGTGIYTYTLHIDSSVDFNYFSTLHVLLGYQSIESDTTNYNGSLNGGFVGGGIRVRSVTDYTSSNIVAKQRRYIYDYTQAVNGGSQNFSYGRLMAYPEYFRYTQIPRSDQTGWCSSLTAFGSSISSISSVISGNIVGYDNVTEVLVDPVSDHDIGKTVYTYFNSSDTPIAYQNLRLPGMLNMGNNLNGSLLSRTVYKNAGEAYVPVEGTNNFYHTTNRSVYFSAKYQFLNPITAMASAHCSGDTATPAWVEVDMYPSIKSERVLLDSTVDFVYDQTVSALALQESKHFYYDNPVHYQMTRSISQDSKANTSVQLTKYPQDYIPAGGTVTGNTNLDAMIAANRVADVIETRDSLYHSGSSVGMVTGAQLQTYRLLPNGFPAKDKVYRLDLAAPVNDFQPYSISGNVVSQDGRYRQLISFNRYDVKSNVVEYTTSNAPTVNYIWDYSHAFPIARVINSDSVSSAYTSFEGDGSGGWTIGTGSANSFGVTGNRCYSLAGTMSKTGLSSANSYIISYWVQGTSNPFTISGGSSAVQGKTISIDGRQWTYFEVKATGITTASILGTGVLDEVRLYPANAQMTTYTYTPEIGMTSQCDIANRVSYFSYDVLGRLQMVRDQDGNVTKTIDYHYSTH
ncbi:MAG TPA: hypothetical protein VGN00_22750 [Puia sp.]|jgi:hypothetical protein